MADCNLPQLCHCGIPANVYNRRDRKGVLRTSINCRNKRSKDGCKMDGLVDSSSPPGSTVVVRVNLQGVIHPRTKEHAFAVKVIPVKAAGHDALSPHRQSIEEVLRSLGGEAIMVSGLEQGQLTIFGISIYEEVFDRLLRIVQCSNKEVAMTSIPTSVLSILRGTWEGGRLPSATPLKRRGDSMPTRFTLTTPLPPTQDNSFTMPTDHQQQPIDVDGSISTQMERRQTIRHDPLFAPVLREFQKVGVDFVLSRDGRAMIADEMGLGKTVQAVAVMHVYRDEWPALVVCPLSLMANWSNEISKLCNIPRSRIHLWTGKVAVPDGTSIVITSNSHDRLDKLYATGRQFRVVVFDESHFMKNSVAKRSKSALKLAEASKRLLLLSGTPTLARPEELYSQLHALNPTMFSNHDLFIRRYCNAYRSFWSYGLDAKGHSNLEELQVLMRQVMIRRKKKDVLTELPDKVREVLYLNLDSAEAKQISSVKLNAAKKAAESGGGAVNKASSFELWEATGRAKLKSILNYLEEQLERMDEEEEEGVVPEENLTKIIFFAHHQFMMDELENFIMGRTHGTKAAKKAKIRECIRIDGKTNAADRQQLVDHFQKSPKVRVAVLSMMACGTGLNITAANQVVFTELDWSPSTLLQCEDRVHRMGQKADCLIRYLLANDTLDEVMWPSLQEKMLVSHAVVSDDMTHADDATLLCGAETKNVERTDVTATTTSGAAAPNGQGRGAKQQSLDSWLVPKASSPKVQAATSASGVGDSRAGRTHAVVGASPTLQLQPHVQVGAARVSSSPVLFDDGDDEVIICERPPPSVVVEVPSDTAAAGGKPRAPSLPSTSRQADASRSAMATIAPNSAPLPRATTTFTLAAAAAGGVPPPPPRPKRTIIQPSLTAATTPTSTGPTSTTSNEVLRMEPPLCGVSPAAPAAAASVHSSSSAATIPTLTNLNTKRSKRTLFVPQRSALPLPTTTTTTGATTDYSIDAVMTTHQQQQREVVPEGDDAAQRSKREREVETICLDL